VKTFISLTWTENISDSQARVLIYTVSEIMVRVGERVGAWFQSQVLPTIRPFGNWTIPAMTHGSAYSSAGWYLDHARASDSESIDGSAYLRLVELEPWQGSTPHFDLALIAEELVDAEGQSILNVALPGLATVASTYHVQQLGSQEAQILGLRHLVTHAMGRAVGVPLPTRSTNVTSHGDDLYCTGLCAMRPCMHLRDLLEYGMEGANQPCLLCDLCEHDLDAILIGSHYGLN
jgi:hypothetical protein